METVTDPEDLPLYSRAYTYDSNGNTLSDGMKTFSYDSKNRLESFESVTDTVTYTYDTDNLRTSKTVNGSTTNYVLCKTCRYARVIEELDGTGTLKKNYTYGNSLLGYGIEGGLDHGFVLDGHGSVRKVTYNGIIQAEYDYSAYGELTSETGWAVAYNDFRYSGEQYDPDLDQYYLRARYYNQNVGRFHNMDDWQGTLSRPLSLNKYNYTESNPVMGIDPSGRFSIGEMSSTLAIISVLSSIAVPSSSTIIYDDGCKDCRKCENIAVFKSDVDLIAKNKRYGHWWVEVNYNYKNVDFFNLGERGFGWWPTLLEGEEKPWCYPVCEVSGILNDGEYNDPYLDILKRKTSIINDHFNVVMKKDNSELKKMKNKQFACMNIATGIENFANKYSANFGGKWAYPDKSCHNFIYNMMYFLELEE